MDELDNRIMSLRWRSENRSDGETSCTSFWRRAVRNRRCRQTWLYMHNIFKKIPEREGDVAEKDSGDKL